MCDKCGTVLDKVLGGGLPKELAFKRYLDTMGQQTVECLGKTHFRESEESRPVS